MKGQTQDAAPGASNHMAKEHGHEENHKEHHHHHHGDNSDNSHIFANAVAALSPLGVASLYPVDVYAHQATGRPEYEADAELSHKSTVASQASNSNSNGSGSGSGTEQHHHHMADIKDGLHHLSEKLHHHPGS